MNANFRPSSIIPTRFGRMVLRCSTRITMLWLLLVVLCFSPMTEISAFSSSTSSPSTRQSKTTTPGRDGDAWKASIRNDDPSNSATTLHQSWQPESRQQQDDTRQDGELLLGGDEEEAATTTTTVNRRTWLWTSMRCATPLLLISTSNDLVGASTIAHAATPVVDTTRIRGRVAGDLQEPTLQQATSEEVFFPEVLLGKWNCRKTVVRVNGDRNQAELTWKALGGGGGFGGGDDDDDASSSSSSSRLGSTGNKGIEMFDTAFVRSPPPVAVEASSIGSPTRSTTDTERRGSGVVLDRGFELESRLRSGNQQQEKRKVVVNWDAECPDTIQYEIGKRAIGGIDLTVVQRNIDTAAPLGNGKHQFTFNEWIQIRSNRSNNNAKYTSSSGGDCSLVVPFQRRTARITKQYRVVSSDRVEVVEIIDTFRVKCGVDVPTDASPTSTTKSRMQMTRFPEKSVGTSTKQE